MNCQILFSKSFTPFDVFYWKNQCMLVVEENKQVSYHQVCDNQMLKFPSCSKLYLVFFKGKLRFRCHTTTLSPPRAGPMSLFHRHGIVF